ncbi:tripartite tricarboxylate transporter TctB family protein [Aureimonas psammosilenae]|jgi:putative tricarboxylic transport membrane protein|uniref:tripartite tricarboxylate transporter TctB family protein n=1 Tax=Aureimonas psammosilenae TaxID=2495496 RepID=UPI0012608ECC|nr:tripartite tricarboxylate transporter TctB family protein [Aureimonas psammosilenae]
MSTVVQTARNRDILAGAIFVVIALLFAWEGSNYPLGRALRMGPGFIPLLLAGTLTVLGICVLVSGLKKQERAEIGAVPWKGIAFVLAALVLFGEGGALLGLVPTVFLCVAIVALASSQNSVRDALGIAALITLLSWLVFKVGLSVSLPTFGPLFSF